MANQEQDPPKEKVDLFDVLHQGASLDKQFDPAGYLYHLSQDQRLRKYSVVFNPEQTRQKYANDPSYKDKVDPATGAPLLDVDIARTTTLFKENILASAEAKYNKYYRPPMNRAESMGVWPAPETESTRAYVDEYEHHGAEGTVTPVGGNRQALAANAPRFKDRSGQILPLTEKDLDERMFSVEIDQFTDPYGNNKRAPILQELKLGQSVYGKEIYSKWGGKPDERTWLGAAFVEAYNSLGTVASPIAAVWENSLGQTSRLRLKTLYNAYKEFEGPKRALTVDELYQRGVLYPSNAGDITPDFLNHVKDEDLYALLDTFQADEEHIRQQALAS